MARLHLFSYQGMKNMCQMLDLLATIDAEKAMTVPDLCNGRMNQASFGKCQAIS